VADTHALDIGYRVARAGGKPARGNAKLPSPPSLL